MKEQTLQPVPFTLQEDLQQFAGTFPLFEELRGNSFLITGATGLLGSITLSCLQALNCQHNLGLRLIALVRNHDKAVQLFGKTIEYIVSDMDDPLLSTLLNNLGSVDYILHFAAPTASMTFVQQPVETIGTITRGTSALLEYARHFPGKGMAFLSTLEVYGTVTDDADAVTETVQGYLDPMAVRSSYPMAKRLGECLCHSYAEEYGLPVKVVRLTQTFGAGVSATDNRVFAQFARSIIEGRDIVLHTTGELSRPYCYTTDAVSAILYILLRGNNGEAYNVANEETYISIRDMAEFLQKHFNPAIAVRLELGDHGYMPPTRLRLSAAKVRALGWSPQYGLETMFSRLIKGMQENS